MEEVIFTKKLVGSGKRVIITIPKDISDSLELKPRDLVEVKLRVVKKQG